MCNFFTPWIVCSLRKNYLLLIPEGSLFYLHFPTPSYQPNCACACLCKDRHTHTCTLTLYLPISVSLPSGNALYILCRVITDPAELLAFLMLILSEIVLWHRDWVPKPSIYWNPFTEPRSIKSVIVIILGKLSVMMGTRIHHYSMLSYYFNTVHMPLDV